MTERKKNREKKKKERKNKEKNGRENKVGEKVTLFCPID